jgi:hypothetical protein
MQNDKLNIAPVFILVSFPSFMWPGKCYAFGSFIFVSISKNSKEARSCTNNRDTCAMATGKNSKAREVDEDAPCPAWSAVSLTLTLSQSTWTLVLKQARLLFYQLVRLIK